MNESRIPETIRITRVPGSVVLITGGSSGIGFQVAFDMAKQGARVILASHNADRLYQAREAIQRAGGDVSSHVCDVTSQQDIDGLVARVKAEYRHVDVLVNNAGYAVYETFEESSLEEVIRLVDVNLVGAIRCTKAFLPGMIERRSGRIVNVASIAGRLIITPNAVYGAAKHAMVALSEALRYELGDFGIQVNVICPGRVETPFFDHPTFRQRAPRAETRHTVSIEKVSRAILDAISRDRFITYVPARLGLLVWLSNALPFLVKPLYGLLLKSRVRLVYASKGK